MRRIIYLLALVTFGSYVFTSCETYYEPNLEEVDPRLVVEGKVINGNGPHLVKLTQSNSYLGKSVFPGVSGATLTLSDDAGNSDLMVEDSAGYYFSKNLEGVPGRTYTLSIEYNGEEFTSSSTMPDAFSIDTSLFYFDDGSASLFVDSGFYVLGGFVDPGELNYYRMHAYVGDTLGEVRTPWNGVPVQDFELGGQLGEDRLVFVNPYVAFDWGDTVTVVITSVNRDSYNYFVALSESKASGGGFGSIPQNPPSNVYNTDQDKDDALGFFDAVSQDQFVVRINF